MTKYARTENNIVQEVFTPPEGFSISDCFHENLVELFVEVAEEVELGWVKDAEDNWSAPAE